MIGRETLNVDERDSVRQGSYEPVVASMVALELLPYGQDEQELDVAGVSPDSSSLSVKFADQGWISAAAGVRHLGLVRVVSGSLVAQVVRYLRAAVEDQHREVVVSVQRSCDPFVETAVDLVVALLCWDSFSAVVEVPGGKAFA